MESITRPQSLVGTAAVAGALRFTLALDAQRGVGQGIQPATVILPCSFAHPILAGAHTFQHFDLANSRLSTSASCELISSWAESRATSTTSPALAELVEQAEIAGQSLAQCVASHHQELSHLRNSVFACHASPYPSDVGRRR